MSLAPEGGCRKTNLFPGEFRIPGLENKVSTSEGPRTFPKNQVEISLMPKSKQENVPINTIHH